MTSTSYIPFTHHVVPLEDVVKFSTTSTAVGAITAGSSLKVDLRRFNSCRLKGVELQLQSFKADFAATGTAAQYGVNLYVIGRTPDNEALFNKAYTVPVYTNGTTEISKSAAASAFIPFSPGDITVAGTDYQWCGKRLAELQVGLEVTGGTTGGGFTLEGELATLVDFRGVELPLTSSSYDSFAKNGTSVSFVPSEGGYQVYLPATANASAVYATT